MIRHSYLRQSDLSPRPSRLANPSKLLSDKAAIKTSLITNDDSDSDEMVNFISEELFSNTRVTKDLVGKYMAIRMFLSVLLITNIFIGLAIYEYVGLEPGNNTRVCRFLCGINTVITACSLVAWAVGKYYASSLSRARLELSKHVTYLQDYGKTRFFIVIFLFMFHPFAPLINVRFFWLENYWQTPDNVFMTYTRPTIEHLIIVQFIFNIFLILKVLLELIKYANNRGHRIARFFGVTIDFVYMFRAIMVAFVIATLLVPLMRNVTPKPLPSR